MASFQYDEDYTKVYVTIYTNELDIKGKKKRKRFTIYNEDGLTPERFKTYAETEAAKIEDSAKENSGFNSLTKLGVFCKQYFFKEYAIEEYKITTYNSWSLDYDKFIVPRFADVSLCKITSYQISQWLKEMNKKGYSYSKTKRIYYCLKAIFDEAFRLQLVEKNPCDSVVLKPTAEQKKKRKYVRAFTPDEVRKLMVKIDELPSLMMQCCFYLAIYTGLRIGEIIALTWDDVDFENSKVTVNKTRTRLGRGIGWVTTEPKTRSANRQVYLPEAVHQVLKDWKELQEYLRKMNDLELIEDENFGKMDFIATNEKGNTVCKELFNYYLDKWTKEINEDEKILAKQEGREPEVMEYKSFHSFRHFYASYLVNNNVSLVVARDLLGHKDIRTTFDIYSESFEDTVRDELEGLFNELDSEENEE